MKLKDLIKATFFSRKIIVVTTIFDTLQTITFVAQGKVSFYALVSPILVLS